MIVKPSKQGKYLRTVDLDADCDTVLVVCEVEEEMIRDQWKNEVVAKPVMSFEHSEMIGDKKLILRDVHINALTALFGTNDSKKWEGTAIAFYVDQDVFPKPGIRIRRQFPDENPS